MSDSILQLYETTEDFIYAGLVALSITPLSPMVEPELTAIHFVYAKAGLLDKNLRVQSFIWEIAKVCVGWSIFDKELHSRYQDMYEAISKFVIIDELTTAEKTEIMIAGKKVLDNVDLLNNAIQVIGYKNVNLSRLKEEILNGTNRSNN